MEDLESVNKFNGDFEDRTDRKARVASFEDLLEVLTKVGLDEVIILFVAAVEGDLRKAWT